MDIDSSLRDDLDIQMLAAPDKNKDDESMDDECVSVHSMDNVIKDINNPRHNNPIEESCIKQLHCAHLKIDQACNNIEMIEGFTNKILDTLSTKAAYREDASSESDSDVSSFIFD